VQVIPISSLDENIGKWTIRARVSHRYGPRPYDNGRTRGKVLNVTFLDATGEIQAACFDQKTDMFKEVLQIGSVVTVSNATIKPGCVPPPPPSNFFMGNVVLVSKVSPVSDSVPTPPYVWAT
jgi:hypothetical protein